MPLRAVRRTSWAPFTWAAVPACATWRVAASTWWTRSRSSTRSSSSVSAAASHGAAGPVGGRRATVVGQREDAPSGLGGGRLDQALVLELLERGIDRAGARRPVAAAALGDHLDDLVAVHRLLGEEREDGGADVAAACPAAGAEERRRTRRSRRVPSPVAPVAVGAVGPLAGHEPEVHRVVAPAAAGPGGGLVIAVIVRSFLSCAITIYRNASFVKPDNRPAG